MVRCASEGSIFSTTGAIYRFYLKGRGTRSTVSISKSRSNYLGSSSVSSPPYAHPKSTTTNSFIGKRSIIHPPELVTTFPSPRVLPFGSINQITHSLYLCLITGPSIHPSNKQTNKQNRNPPHLTSPHLTSPHLTSPHLTHLTSPTPPNPGRKKKETKKPPGERAE